MENESEAAVGVRAERWTESEARAALEELARSGSSLAQFARSRGVSTQRLAYWRKRLASASPPGFVSVAMPRAPARAHVEIVSGGVVIRVREDLDVEQLAAIVEALDRRARQC